MDSCNAAGGRCPPELDIHMHRSFSRGVRVDEGGGGCHAYSPPPRAGFPLVKTISLMNQCRWRPQISNDGGRGRGGEQCVGDFVMEMMPSGDIMAAWTHCAPSPSL
jgi:hypothetical protein